ncbi:MAG: hypothetical protein GY757_32860 [bacterium]|nr:hypothetical protein [bacterium]
MKKQKVILVLVCILLVTGVMLQAKVKTGRAIIPHFSADYPGGSSSNIPYFFCTNITDDDITVTYVFYKDDGTLLQDSGNSSTTGPIIASFFSGTYSETVSGTSVSFVLGAHKSAQIRIENTGGHIIGHGYVE